MPWIEIDSVTLANGDRLTLRRDGETFEIRLNLFQLMCSGNSVSERALAKACCAGARDVLIGGLGLGYTARAVLDEVVPEARVTVAELVPAVVQWNRSVLAPLAGRPLDDPRLKVVVGDVANAVRAHPASFDAILLDVDNGPEAVLFAANAFLYSHAGVELLRAGLKPGGILAVWAAAPSPAFEAVLRESGFAFAVQTLEVQPGLTHTIYRVG
jgi:spermidine synthase